MSHDDQDDQTVMMEQERRAAPQGDAGQDDDIAHSGSRTC